MKKITKITTVIIVALGLSAAGAAYAAKSHHGGGKGLGLYAVAHIAKKLDLDPTQEQSLTVLKDQMLIAKTAMREQMQSARDEMLGLVGAESFDQGKALALISQKTATIDSVAPELVVALGNFMDTLNAEQKQEVLELVNKRHEKRKRRQSSD